MAKRKIKIEITVEGAYWETDAQKIMELLVAKFGKGEGE